MKKYIKKYIKTYINAGKTGTSVADMMKPHTSECGLYTIAGRPAIGKKFIAKKFAHEMMESHHKTIAYLASRYMSKRELKELRKEFTYFFYEPYLYAERVEEIIRETDVDIFIIDCYQYMNREHMDCAALLGTTAWMYEKQIFVLSGVSRKPDSRKNKRPTRRDMTKKLCDGLWRASNAVFFLYRDAYYFDTEGDDSIEKSGLELIVAKDVQKNAHPIL